MEINSVPSLEDAQSYVQSIDFSKIIDRLVTHEGWLKSDATAVSQMYRRYLFLKRKYKDQYKLPPTAEIDEFWHNHILDTKCYRQDCQAIFGAYLDHYPYFGGDEYSTTKDLIKAFSKLQEIYRQEFGKDIYQVRGVIKKVISFFKKTFRKSIVFELSMNQ